jgi:uncharacterized protein (TIGR03435 family)
LVSRKGAKIAKVGYVKSMPRSSIIIAVVCCVSSFGFGQNFEVSSVKRLDPDSGSPGSNRMRGGPGTDDPGRITFPSVTMRRLLSAAYGIDMDRISGPGWLDSERYAVVANVPPGTTQEQLKLMLQSLIAERFHAVLHYATKQVSGYELVAAKRGPKLRPSVEDANPPARVPATVTGKGLIRLTFNRSSLSDLANMLGSFPLAELAGDRVTPALVVDNTGLTGKYDFTLEFAGSLGPGGANPSDANGPGLFDALETQLGLRLEEKKVRQDVFVIDFINTIPVED